MIPRTGILGQRHPVAPDRRLGHRAAQVGAPVIEVDHPPAVLEGLPFSDRRIEVPQALDGTPFGIRTATGRRWLAGILAGGENVVDGHRRTRGGELPLTVSGPGVRHCRLAPRSARLALLIPPLLAIAFALIFREVVVSLFAGIWLGALFVAG
jgi:hypothetical protein